MSELHAAVVLAGIDHLDNRVKHRNSIAQQYRDGLGELPGVGFQEVPAGRRSSVKDFTITVSPDFEVDRDVVVAALKAEGIPTRPYYSPPLHRQTAYADLETPALPVTENLASQVISLPVWSDMSEDMVESIIGAIGRIHRERAAL
jgi:dTDP-4-amino-4,6-dideoxygalactose transaminase